MKKYQKDYELILKTQANGKVKEEVKYIGNYYVCQLSDEALKRKKIYYFALSLSSVVLLIILGIINTSSSRVLYVSLPYVCIFPPAIYSLIGSTQFLKVDKKIEYVKYDKTRNRVRKSTLGIAVISLLAIIGDGFFIFYHYPINKFITELLFLTGLIFLFIINVFFLYQIQRQEIFKIEETVK